MASQPPRSKSDPDDADQRDFEIPVWANTGIETSAGLASMVTLPSSSAYDQQCSGTSGSSFWAEHHITSSQEHVHSDRNLCPPLSPSSGLPQYVIHTSTTDFPWQMDEELDRKQRDVTAHGARQISGFSDMDTTLIIDPSYMSFTQSLQESMNMDPSSYSDMSKVMSACLDPSGSGFDTRQEAISGFSGFATAERRPSSSFPRVESEGIPSSSSPSVSGFFDYPSSSVAIDKPQSETQTSGPSGDALTRPGTPGSSLSSTSSEGHDEDFTRASATGGATIDDERATPDKVPEEGATSEKPSSDATKKPSKPRKKGQKRNRAPRVALVTKSEVEHLEDGFRWRKYGQKAVKNSPFPRSYYRCTNSKCSVKKRVERSSEDPSMVVTTYEGQHTHHSPAVLRGTTESQYPDPRIAASFSQTPLFPLPSLQLPRQLTTPGSNLDFPMQLQRQELSSLPLALTRPALPLQPPQIRGPHQQTSQPSLLQTSNEGLLEDMFPYGVRKNL